MVRPVRLQLSRRKGFSLQALSRETNGLEAVKVTRPGPWGNPFPITKGIATSMGVTSPIWSVGTWEGPAMWFRHTEAEAIELSVAAFKTWVCQPAQSRLLDQARLGLRGKNLACFCRPGQLCHADIWIELANPNPDGAEP